jgi:hypothetical protein
MAATAEAVWSSADEVPFLQTWAQKTQSGLVSTLFPGQPLLCPVSLEPALVGSHYYVL